ncbi:MAG: purine-binding chemotaxis protein CheW [Burkholderiales bacterium]|nr:purine-binding chemotaxis protein CheW [Burkholderiales bacterium]
MSDYKQVPSPEGNATSVDAALQYLTFTLGDEVFAMDIRTVREIIQHTAMTTVPLMPDFVQGVINLRGAVVPVIDLQSRFGRSKVQIGKKTCIVIFDAGRDGEHIELGLMVDAVSEVVDISSAEIEPTPSFGTSIAREFILGVGKVGKNFMPIIDTDKALSVDDMAAIIAAHTA